MKGFNDPKACQSGSGWGQEKFGGKAQGLYEAIQMGLPVPESGAIPTETFQDGQEVTIDFDRGRVDVQSLPR